MLKSKKYTDFLKRHEGEMYSTKELLKLLGNRTEISRFKKAGVLKQISRGLYIVGEDIHNPANENLIALAKTHPNAVVSGTSSLYYHGLGEQFPSPLSVDIPRNSTLTENDLFIATRVGRSKLIGIEDYRIDKKHNVKMYSKERSLIDLLKNGGTPHSEAFHKAIDIYHERFLDLQKLNDFSRTFKREVRIILEYISFLNTIRSPY